MKIFKTFEFCASHVLKYDTLKDEQNQALFGKCFRTHGHNYALEICVQGELDMERGYFLNYSHLSEIVHHEIITQLDHQHLNDTPFMRGKIPTAENIGQLIFNALDPLLKNNNYHLYSCKLYETRTNSVKIYSSLD